MISVEISVRVGYNSLSEEPQTIKGEPPSQGASSLDHPTATAETTLPALYTTTPATTVTTGGGRFGITSYSVGGAAE